MMSLYQYFDDAAVSPGRLKLARELIAILCARPIPASSIPPHHNGMSFFTHRLWIRLDSEKPPTRLILRLIILQLTISIACLASSYDVILSSMLTEDVMFFYKVS